MPIPNTTNPPTADPVVESDPVIHRHPDPAALRKVFTEWQAADPEEQRATFEYLRQSLDEDRPAGYKLFP